MFSSFVLDEGLNVIQALLHFAPSFEGLLLIFALSWAGQESHFHWMLLYAFQTLEGFAVSAAF